MSWEPVHWRRAVKLADRCSCCSRQVRAPRGHHVDGVMVAYVWVCEHCDLIAPDPPPYRVRVR
jgi:hypothetical protein